MKKLIQEFEEMCGTLAISHDSPNEETIKEYFEKYHELKQLKLNGVLEPLKEQETPTFEEWFKDKYMEISGTYFHRTYHFEKTKEQALKIYNTLLPNL